MKYHAILPYLFEDAKHETSAYIPELVGLVGFSCLLTKSKHRPKYPHQQRKKNNWHSLAYSAIHGFLKEQTVAIHM